MENNIVLILVVAFYSIVSPTCFGQKMSEDPVKSEQAEISDRLKAVSGLVDRIKKGECYNILIMPMVYDPRDEGIDDRHQKALAPDFAVLSKSEVNKFLDFLAKGKDADFLDSGSQYYVRFIMNKSPTTVDTFLVMRRSKNGWCVIYGNERRALGSEFGKWMADKLVAFDETNKPSPK